MITIKVIFKNGDSLITDINTDLEGAKKYYLSKWFNLGNADKDVMTEAVEVKLV